MPFNHPSFSQQRRQFLKYGLLASASLALASSCHSESQSEESATPTTTTQAESPSQVIVIGAGIAGLAAAQQLKADGFEAIVLEARDRVGGRIWTDRSLGVPIDMGASWIHGPEDNPITPLAAKARARTFVTQDANEAVYDVSGRLIPKSVVSQSEEHYNALLKQIAELTDAEDQDISIAEAIRRIDAAELQDLLIQYQLAAYMEFETGGPIEKLSARSWADDRSFAGEDVLFPNGYDAVINLLAKGLTIKLGQVVTQIAPTNAGVTVTTNQGSFTGQCAVVTLPLGVLKQKRVTFNPGLPAPMMAAIDRIEMGTVNKVALRFPKAFWETEVQFFGFTSQTKGKYPYFLNAHTFTAANALVTFGLGNYGLAMESQSNQQIEADVLETLKTMFGKVEQPEAVLVSRWTADPFTGGSYSYPGVGATPEDFAALAEPIADRLFFAGEHTIHQYRASVHGAYLTGIREARRIKDLYG